MPERVVARVDLGAVRANCTRLTQRLTEGSRLCAVVKADGYGHGATACARAALDGGAAGLAVATAAEAISLRADLADARIFVMGSLSPDELDAALSVDADIALWRDDFRVLASERAQAAGRVARVHVKFDSGMGRLGTPDSEEVLALVGACQADPAVDPVAVWTHFATADDRDSDFFEEQLARFESLAARLREEHPRIALHAANSAATLRQPRSHFDMVRCGIAVYGMDPFGVDAAEAGLQPAMSVHSRVADVKRFPQGASAGYGQTWRAPRDTWVAVIPVGYGDGVRRALSNSGEVLIGGRRYGITGTISMDNLTVDLGPETDVRLGDKVVLLGTQGEGSITAEEMAETLGTINYEVTCGISPRVPRVLAEEGSGDPG